MNANPPPKKKTIEEMTPEEREAFLNEAAKLLETNKKELAGKIMLGAVGRAAAGISKLRTRNYVTRDEAKAGKFSQSTVLCHLRYLSVFGSKMKNRTMNIVLASKIQKKSKGVGRRLVLEKDNGWSLVFRRVK